VHFAKTLQISKAYGKSKAKRRFADLSLAFITLSAFNQPHDLTVANSDAAQLETPNRCKLDTRRFAVFDDVPDASDSRKVHHPSNYSKFRLSAKEND
jgi:hypothetical protein